MSSWFHTVLRLLLLMFFLRSHFPENLGRSSKQPSWIFPKGKMDGKKTLPNSYPSPVPGMWKWVRIQPTRSDNFLENAWKRGIVDSRPSSHIDLGEINPGKKRGKCSDERIWHSVESDSAVVCWCLLLLFGRALFHWAQASIDVWNLPLSRLDSTQPDVMSLFKRRGAWCALRLKVGMAQKYSSVRKWGCQSHESYERGVLQGKFVLVFWGEATFLLEAGQGA